MTSPDNKTIEDAIEKVCTNPAFTKEEVTALKAVADAWRGFQAMGRVAVAIQRIAMWVGWLIGAYIVAQTVAGDWIKGLVR